MSPLRALARAGWLALAGLALAGCISVLPKTPPAQLYRFGAAEQADPAAPGAGMIGKGAVSFDSAAQTDRILTVTGGTAAYIAGARWVSPAPVLFDEALTRTFERTPGAPRLAQRGGVFNAPLILTVDVEAFEARYDQGAEAAPTVVVQVRALLIRTSDRTVAAEKNFSTSQRASDNRVGAIVEAFDQAVQKTLTDLTTWSGAQAGA